MSGHSPTLDDAPRLQARFARGPSSLIANRNFVLLWAAYGVSAIGDHISEMALLNAQHAMESEITRLQAIISFMFFLPYFVLGPLTGLLADRAPRRGLMIFADLVRAALMFNFAFLIHKFEGSGPWAAFTPVLLAGIFAAVFSPARSALLPTLIAEDQLVRANAMTSGLGVIASMLAMQIGGFLADYYPPQYAFTIDGCTFLLSAALLLGIALPRNETQRRRSDIGPGALAEAVRYIRGHRRVAELIGVAVVVWACGALVRTVVPAIVRDVYGYHRYTTMSSMLVFLGAGMLAGAIILTALGDALRSELAITWSLAGIAAAIGLLAVTVFAGLHGSPGYYLGGTAVLISGVFAAGTMASYNALLQRIVPNRIRGRVFGLIDLVTIAGLLLATGALGIPPWQHVDRWVGWILVFVMLVVAATAAASLALRLGTSSLSRSVQFWMNVTEFYCKWWFRLRREGVNTVPAEGPVIVVANHTNAVDPLLLIASTTHRALAFMIAREYYSIPLAGRLIRMIGCIPVSREEADAAAVKAALRHLRAGRPLGIFIEGRIVPPGEHFEPKDGAALLALKTGAPVVPAHISGTEYEPSIARSFFRRYHARVRFGKPIDLSGYHRRVDKDTLSRITRMLDERIHELGK